MVWQFKKIFPIFLALFLGVAVIIVAVKGGSIFGTTISFTTKKEDNSWKSALSIVPGDNSLTRVEKGVIKKEDSLSGATTTTDILSQKIILEYAAFQRRTATTTLSDNDAETIATSLVQEVELPLGTEYQASDLNVSKDNSDVAIALYLKDLTTLMQTFSAAHKVSELDIINDAIANDDAQKLQDLAPILTQYEKLKKGLLLLKTPSLMVPLHLRLVQSYSNIQSSIIVMQKIFTDAIQGLAGITQYQKEIEVLNTLETEYLKYAPARQ